MRRDRRVLAVLAVVLVGMGAAARFGLPGTTADILGGLFYAGLVYVLCALVAPATRPSRLGLCAAGWSLGVEILQLTGLPAALGRAFAPLRLVFGSGFAALDLVTAATGVLVAVLVDRSVAGHRERRRPPVG